LHTGEGKREHLPQQAYASWEKENGRTSQSENLVQNVAGGPLVQSPRKKSDPELPYIIKHRQRTEAPREGGGQKRQKT